jgi:hypothetical protein
VNASIRGVVEHAPGNAIVGGLRILVQLRGAAATDPA